MDLINRDWLIVKHAPPRRRFTELDDVGQPGSPSASILEIVAKSFDTTVAMLKGPRRGRELAHARFAAVALLLEFCPHLSLPGIGHIVGQRDHTTIIHARFRAGQLLEPDKHSAPWRERYFAARIRILGTL